MKTILIVVMIGVIVVFTWGPGIKLYNSFTRQLICKISFKKKNNIGYSYNWTVIAKDKNQGALILYPKVNALIRLSSIKKSDRIFDVRHLGNGKFSRVVKFIYTDGNEPMQLDFETYSYKQLGIPNTKDVTCEDLLFGSIEKINNIFKLIEQVSLWESILKQFKGELNETIN
jgi:hypothetical protein